MMEIQEGYIPFLCGKTYYRIVGGAYQKTPLLLLHGGPGSTHNSLELLDEIACISKRPVIAYDQIGCGKSSLDGSHKELYNASTWVKELVNIREKLNLDEVHILGHSWGGMLNIIYNCQMQPQGVKSMILSSTLSSASLWDKETHRLVKYLPQKDQDAIKKAEEENDYSSLEFKLANLRYMKMTVSDIDFSSSLTPECLKLEKKRGEEAYETAWGPSEFKPLGNLSDYEYTSRLSSITCPVLLLSGSDDESTPLQNKLMYDSLTNATLKKWHLFSPARHMTYFEKRDEYLKTVRAFLDEVEKSS